MVVAIFVVAAIIIPAKAETVNLITSSSGSATTSTCALSGVAQYDVLVMAISATKAISTVADSSGNTYTQRVASTLATATVASQTYIYTAPATTVPARGSLLTITATWATSAQAVAVCYDTAGFLGTAAHTSTGSGALTNTLSGYSAVVGSYSPTINNLEISVFGGSVCGATATITPPAANTKSTLITTAVNTATSCRTSAPLNTFEYIGGSAYYLPASGAAQTDTYVVSGPSAVNSTNSADWTEAALDLGANTVVTQSLAETALLTAHNALQNPAVTETASLAQHLALENPLLTEPMALFTKFALPQPFNTEQFCLGIATTVNSVPTLTVPANCVAQVITGQTLVLACNWFQLQCWLYSMMFIGLYEGLFIGIAIGFRFSEKGFVYWAICGATIASLAAIQLGIMTPMVPIMLIVVNVAYSFRLDRLITSRGGTSE